MTPKLWALIPAAGSGSRMHAQRPKQYLPLAGKTLLQVTLDKFLSRSDLSGILVATAAEDEWFVALNLPVLRCAGGATRAQSVLAGLEYLSGLGASPDDFVLVHDAARPCVTQDSLNRLIQTVVTAKQGALLACPVCDTLKQASSDPAPQSLNTLDRSRIWQAHTPQMFALGQLKYALQSAQAQGLTVTDEASALELMGISPLLVADRRDNIKVTLPEDLPLAEFILQRHGELGL